jgi:hypothetical protein
MKDGSQDTADDRGPSSQPTQPEAAEHHPADPMRPKQEAPPTASTAAPASRIARLWEEFGGTIFVVAAWIALITVLVTRRTCG